MLESLEIERVVWLLELLSLDEATLLKILNRLPSLVWRVTSLTDCLLSLVCCYLSSILDSKGLARVVLLAHMRALKRYDQRVFMEML